MNRIQARHIGQEFVQGIEELIWPTSCVGCGVSGTLLCEGCKARLQWIDQRWACSKCGAPFGWLVCTQCKHDWIVDRCICACVFDQLSAAMVTCFKDAREIRLGFYMAAIMEVALAEAGLWDEAVRSLAPGMDRDLDPYAIKLKQQALEFDCISFVPASHRAYLKRGFDHMELIAQIIGGLLGIPVLDSLKRRSSEDQRNLQPDQRSKNLSLSMYAAVDVYGLNILLIDDVVTTGASMEVCAASLKARGANSVVGLSFARVWS